MALDYHITMMNYNMFPSEILVHLLQHCLTFLISFPTSSKGFHTCVGSGGERQTAEWYKEKGIEMIYEDPVTETDFESKTLTTQSGKQLKYGSLIISTGCIASRWSLKAPEGGTVVQKQKQHERLAGHSHAASPPESIDWFKVEHSYSSASDFQKDSEAAYLAACKALFECYQNLHVVTLNS
ncbi:hypothetical protein Dimus_030890 [Dionaea muscipula]